MRDRVVGLVYLEISRHVRFQGPAKGIVSFAEGNTPKRWQLVHYV